MIINQPKCIIQTILSYVLNREILNVRTTCKSLKYVIQYYIIYYNTSETHKYLTSNENEQKKYFALSPLVSFSIDSTSSYNTNFLTNVHELIIRKHINIDLTKLVKLKKLSLLQVCISYKIIRNLVALIKNGLQTLNIMFSKFDDKSDIKYFSTVPYLSILYCNLCEVPDMHNINLNLRNNQITKCGKLNVVTCNMASTDIQDISMFSNVVHLNISATKIMKVDWSILTKIRTLNISYTNIDIDKVRKILDCKIIKKM